MTEIRTVEQFDAAGAFVTPDEIEAHVRVSADLQQHIDWLKTDIELGFDELILHNVNTEQARFIDVFGETVIPALNPVQGEDAAAVQRILANEHAERLDCPYRYFNIGISRRIVLLMRRPLSLVDY